MADPTVVGLLAAADQLGTALLADALTFAVSLASLLAVRRRVPHPQRRGTGSVHALIADFRVGLGYLLSVRVLVIMTVVQIIVNLCLGTEKLMFYYAKVTLGLGAAGVGAVIAAGGIGGIAGAVSASWLAARVGQMRLVVLAVAAGGRGCGGLGRRAGPADIDGVYVDRLTCPIGPEISEIVSAGVKTVIVIRYNRTRFRSIAKPIRDRARGGGEGRV